MEHKTLNEALVAAAAEMPAVAKTATNPHFKSRYAPLDAVVATAQPVLASHGLALTLQHATIREDVVTVAFTLTGSQDARTIVIESKPRSMTPQDIGSCITYARRYAYAAVGVVTEDDDDGNSTSVKPETAPKAPSRPVEPPAKPTVPAYAEALDDACRAALKRLGWTRQRCIEQWAANPDVKAFRNAVAKAAMALADDKLPL